MYIINQVKKLWESKNYISKIFKYSNGHKNKIAFLTILQTFTYLFGIAIAVLSKSVIDIASDGKSSKILLWLIVYLMLTIMVVIFRSYTQLFQTKMSEKISYKIQKDFLKNYYTMPWYETNKYLVGDIITRLTNDSSKIVSFFSTTVPKLIAQVLQLIVSFIIVLKYDKSIALYGLFIMPIIGVVSIAFGRKMKNYQDIINDTEGQYRSFMNESVRNNIIIRSFEHEDDTVKELEQLQQKKYIIALKKMYTVIGSNFFVQLGFSISSFIAFGWGAYKISSGELTVGTFFALVQLIGRMQMPILEFSRLLPQYIATIASVDRLEPFESPYKKKLISIKELPLILGIKIENLNFNYTNDKTILKDLTTTIHPGENIAIVGYSGIGKTTFLRLIMGLLEQDSGLIQPYNNSNIFENFVSYYSYVPQGNTLFSGTIRDNMRIGNPDANDSQIFEALENACAKDFVMELKNKLDTNLGESGLGLSEGQLQRICIARALIRNTPVLLLDEATSSLDHTTEKEVINRICLNYPNRTIIAITHRPSILDYVDRIIELCHGEVLLIEKSNA